MNKTRGFTIVELLIVIAVITILATITAVVYTGVQDRAREAALQADLDSGMSYLATARFNDGHYPEDLSGFAWGEDTTMTYYVSSTGRAYCLQAGSSSVNATFYANSTDRRIEAGTCSAFPILDAPTNLYVSQGPTYLAFDWMWPSTLAAGNYDMHLTVECAPNSQQVTVESLEGTSGSPDATSSSISIPRTAVSSVCNTMPVRFTGYYIDPATGEQSPSASITITL